MLKFTVSGNFGCVYSELCTSGNSDLKAVDEGVGIQRGGFIDKPNEMFY